MMQYDPVVNILAGLAGGIGKVLIHLGVASLTAFAMMAGFILSQNGIQEL
jgi:hypothetical protein